MAILSLNIKANFPIGVKHRFTPVLLYMGLFICTQFYPYLGYSQFHCDDAYRHYLANKYEEKAKQYLVKSPYVHRYFKIECQGISIYKSPYFKRVGKAEFVLYWEELDDFKTLLATTDRKFHLEYYRQKGRGKNSLADNNAISILKENKVNRGTKSKFPLAGIRIAIDPGHVAGDEHVAEVEGRFIKMTSPRTGRTFKFYEADLTLATAYILKDSLQKLGAEVMLTRQKGNQSIAYGSYYKWEEKVLPYILRMRGLDSRGIKEYMMYYPKNPDFVKYFLPKELDARAKLINAFHPDLTLIVHYNVDVNNHGWKKPTRKNYNLCFMPGAFLSREMVSSTYRFDFLKWLISDNLENSAEFGSILMDKMEEATRVKPVSTFDEPSYLKRYSKKVSYGVYARNLQLMRQLNSPVCYGETLLQDNIAEVVYLSRNNWNKKQASARVVQVAQGYYEAITTYFRIKSLTP